MELNHEIYNENESYTHVVKFFVITLYEILMIAVATYKINFRKIDALNKLKFLCTTQKFTNYTLGGGGGGGV